MSGYIVDVGLVVLGLIIIGISLLPTAPTSPRPQDSAAELEHVRRMFRLAHRFGGRLVQSRVQPVPADILELSRLYVLSRPAIADVGSGLTVVLDVGRPLLELEAAIERMESFSARVRRWGARGRARGQG